ncbi:hypothetical protein like AT5G61340 [Hibiscus trionum]|uniref:Uncharacterized protein n=1 Tax=Hibiscus trionum TaxID=183268 RepID=A0A9W7MVF7_HIBTR|nr:hypothetical protein like AT5G61340 [Hibiscus trionum]
MEKFGRYIAILKACVLIKRRTLTLAVSGNLVLAAIEALFHYCVVSRAYGYGHSGDFCGFSMGLEEVLIAYLYSIFVVVDTVVSSMFFKNCKSEGRYYWIEIVAEEDGNACVKVEEH